jgi:hypothetical protein
VLDAGARTVGSTGTLFSVETGDEQVNGMERKWIRRWEGPAYGVGIPIWGCQK